MRRTATAIVLYCGAALTPLTSFHSPSALAQLWSDLGPAPTTDFGGATGRVSAILAHPTNPSLYYVAGADGGIWRTTNAGQTWMPIADVLPTTAIGAMALDPTNPQIIYAGSGEANFANHSRYGLGLYKSVDGGATWRVLGAADFAGRCFARLVVHPANPAILLAAITRAGGFPTLAAAKGHPLAAAPTGLYRSENAGESWSLVTGGLPAQDCTDIALDPVNPAIMYCAIGNIFGSADNGVYRSINSGSSWSRVTLPRDPASLGRIGLATAPNIVLAYLTAATEPLGSTGTTIGITRSLDGGATWSTPAFIGSATYGWYFARIAVHPVNPAIVYAGELNAYRSINGGLSFSSIGPPHPDVHAFTWDAAGRLLVGCDGGIYRSANGAGSDWVSLNTGLSITQLYAGLSPHPTNANGFLAGLQDNGSVLRTSPTQTWRAVTGGDGGWTQISPHDPAIMLTESQGTGALYRSTTGGASFSSVGSGLTGRNCFEPPFLFDPQVPGRILYATERLWVSTNNGGSFTPLSADLTAGGTAAIRAMAIAPSDPRFVYTATNDGRVLASVDGGATFALRLTGNTGWPRTTRELAVDPRHSATVYLAGATFGAPHVRRSTNAGVFWQVLDGNLPDTPINVIGIEYPPGAAIPTLYAGGDGGVWRSEDDGATWQPFGQGLPAAAVIDLLVEPGRHRIIVGTQGRGVWTIPLPWCPADIVSIGGLPPPDGLVTGDDFNAFIAAFAAGDSLADITGIGGPPEVPDGLITGDDFNAFIAAFAAGCP